VTETDSFVINKSSIKPHFDWVVEIDLVKSSIDTTVKQRAIKKQMTRVPSLSRFFALTPLVIRSGFSESMLENIQIKRIVQALNGCFCKTAIG
jgi:hypothetical protein